MIAMRGPYLSSRSASQSLRGEPELCVEALRVTGACSLAAAINIAGQAERRLMMITTSGVL
ncbi:MAG: hypothetical protein JJU18_06235 [Oceanicaulis sp.]|nr:hypothetical protein [Oceanicaulis sp.]